MTFKILVVGLARNLESTLASNLKILERSFRDEYDVSFFIVESDSTDKTLEVLSKESLNYSNFNYLSLGNLTPKIPDRVARIAHCRDAYVDFIRANFPKNNWDYIAVADLDGVNSLLSKRSIRCALNLDSEWDALTANQLGPYYDIYALRCQNWVDYDCLTAVISERDRLESSSKLIQNRTRFKQVVIEFQLNQVRKHLIYKKMRVIPFWRAPFQVDSAFGGLGIYKSKVFLNHDYKNDDSSRSECEHVTLHRKIISNGGNIFIVPRFINGFWNEHSLNRIWLVRILRRIKHKLRTIIHSSR